ncbi:MAG: stage IV sporulation protein A [Eubacteriales bacterium]|jgi:stage IV sporulation protein A
MEQYSIYHDIAQRTGGAIMLGVVGPVRTGKSTFIKKFMETLVIPNMEDPFSKERAIDELPQSAAGRTIMTTEPKFIPNEAVELQLGEGAACRIRLIDCVGYVVESALGHFEENAPRMVSTPWFDQPIPFEKAAEIGTQKVIQEHSTIGLLVTTDGSICDIPREDYEKAERRVVDELKALHKPFVILLNSAHPDSKETRELAETLQKIYDVSVVRVNCTTLTEEDVKGILRSVLLEFPIREIRVTMPSYVQPLSRQHWLRAAVYKVLLDRCGGISRLREISSVVQGLQECEYVSDVTTGAIQLGEGRVSLEVRLHPELYYKVLSEVSGVEIDSDEDLIGKLQELSAVGREYERVRCALEEVRVKGYGVVTPSVDELTLEEPKIVRQGGRFGIRLRASAPSIHLIRANIETEVSPVVGSEKQSQELMEYLMKDFEVDPQKIWQSNFFGKSLHELVNEGLNNKLYRMPEDARFKIQETLEKIINEGSGGLICIIL